ncbi:hypothetical protein NVP1154O_44 [Vibrio phage 1.154.O._10N.222.52.B12]|nr:hypothetical protein NVP1154O_44 [Vibrio phage 1.154.O._10N.222.52.B12]
MYANTWKHVHGDSSNENLRRFVNGLTPERAQRVFSYCYEQIANGNKFAPNLGELIVFSDTPSESEFYEILCRVQTNKPIEGDRIEVWLCENIRYNLHRVAAGGEIKYLRSQYRHAQALLKSGTLRVAEDELKALPRHSVKNLNDVKREEWESKNGRSLIKRIERIVRGES